jgi:hypothetical protein
VKETEARRDQYDRCSKRVPAYLHRSLQRSLCQARDQDFHRSVDPWQDLDQILFWREQRQVSYQLVVNYSV